MNLREYRNNLGITLRDVEDLTGIGKETIRRIELGTYSRLDENIMSILERELGAGARSAVEESYREKPSPKAVGTYEMTGNRKPMSHRRTMIRGRKVAESWEAAGAAVDPKALEEPVHEVVAVVSEPDGARDSYLGSLKAELSKCLARAKALKAAIEAIELLGGDGE